jgi:hypothetical protein
MCKGGNSHGHSHGGEPCDGHGHGASSSSGGSVSGTTDISMVDVSLIQADGNALNAQHDDGHGHSHDGDHGHSHGGGESQVMMMPLAAPSNHSNLGGDGHRDSGLAIGAIGASTSMPVPTSRSGSLA